MFVVNRHKNIVPCSRRTFYTSGSGSADTNASMRPTIAIFTINRRVRNKWPRTPEHACGIASLKAIVVHVGEIHRDRLVVGRVEVVVLLHDHHSVDFGTQLFAGFICRFLKIYWACVGGAYGAGGRHICFCIVINIFFVPRQK